MAIRTQPQETYTLPMTTDEMRADYALVIRQASRNALARRTE
ncbi:MULTISPECIES: hypothetical protein [Haloferax]|nr:MULTISPECIES: hypothetical protein [Haloferax]